MSESSIPEEQEALVLNELIKPEVETISVIRPGKNQILIKSQAFAVNPTDWKHITGKLGHLGSIVGCDASGVVVEVGPGVNKFKVGDNVSTFLHGAYREIPYPGAFCEYVLGYERTTFKYNYQLQLADSDSIPAGEIDSFEGASSISLSLVTVGYSFYYSLGLDKDDDYSSCSILIWSGSTSVGSIAIQVARWLGFKEIIVTSSPRNFDIMKKFGATHVYDYHDPDIVNKIKTDFGESIIYGLDCYSTTVTYSQTYRCLSDTQDSFLDNLLFLGESDLNVPKLKTTKVKFGNTLSYPTLGEDAYFVGESVFVPARPEMLQKFDKFHKDIQPFLDSRDLLHIPIKIFPKGLYGIVDALTYSKEGAYSNTKLVLKMSDTPE